MKRKISSLTLYPSTSICYKEGLVFSDCKGAFDCTCTNLGFISKRVHVVAVGVTFSFSLQSPMSPFFFCFLSSVYCNNKTF